MAVVDRLERVPVAPPRHPWRNRLLCCALTLFILGGLIAVMRWRIATSSVPDDLTVIIAELDETDPRWRIEDIEADRKIIPDAENTALVIIQIDAALRADPDRLTRLNMPVERANETPPEVQ